MPLFVIIFAWFHYVVMRARCGSIVKCDESVMHTEGVHLVERRVAAARIVVVVYRFAMYACARRTYRNLVPLRLHSVTLFKNCFRGLLVATVPCATGNSQCVRADSIRWGTLRVRPIGFGYRAWGWDTGWAVI